MILALVSTGAKWGALPPTLRFSPRIDTGAARVPSICWISNLWPQILLLLYSVSDAFVRFLSVRSISCVSLKLLDHDVSKQGQG